LLLPRQLRRTGAILLAGLVLGLLFLLGWPRQHGSIESRAPKSSAEGAVSTADQRRTHDGTRAMRSLSRGELQQNESVPSVIRGEVRSSVGEPLPRASVCWGASPSACCSVDDCTLTDDRGQYRIDVGHNGRVLVASAQGYLSETVELSSPVSPSSGVFRLRSASASVTGSVVDASGGPVMDALVSVRAGPGGAVVATARSGVDGRFSLGVAPGPVEITARAEGYSQAPASALLAPAGGVMLYLAPASGISGRVVIEGTEEPVPNVLVSAGNTNGLEATIEPTMSDEEGGFRFDSLPAGAYVLQATGSRWRSNTAWVNVGVGQDSDPLLLEVAPATTLTGTVQADGKPCLDGSIYAVGPVASFAKLDRNGAARLEALLPGVYQVDVACASAVAATESVEIGAEPVTREWDLEGGLKVLGRVESPSGQPLSDIAVTVAPIEPGGPGARCSSDAAGQFECGGLGEGEHECSTQVVGSPSSTARVVVSASAPPPTVVLTGPASGSIRVSVEGVVRAHDVAWQVFAKRKDDVPSVGRPEDEVFAFDKLPMGNYAVYIGDEGTPSAAHVSLQRDKEVALVTLSAPELGAIAGQVVDARQAPIVDAWVRAASVDQAETVGSGATALTDGEGHFTLSELPRGRYDLSVSSTSGEASKKQIETGSTDVVVRLDAYGSVSGTVRTASGELAPTFSISAQQDGADVSAASGESGSWVLPWLAPGSYTITASAPEGSASQQVTLAPAARVELDLTLAPSATTSEVARLAPVEEPPAGAAVQPGPDTLDE
jgi:hypothetical protein